MRLLLIEDNEVVARAAAQGLKARGFVVDIVDNLLSATHAAEAVKYELFLVDRVLPDGDGANWLKKYRDQGGTIPALMLTASADKIEDRVHGLNAGADDYVIKPVHINELVARVKAILRRPSGALSVVLTAGNIRFDSVSREIRVSDEIVIVPKREACLLELLMRRCGKVVPKAAIEEALYNFDKEVTPNAIETSVYRLRGHLNAAASTINIHTVRGVGYMLINGTLKA